MSGEDRDPESFGALAQELEALFGLGVEIPWSEEDFSGWAHRIFEYQYGASVTYRSLCDRRGVTPETLDRWADVPLVPAMAFKHLALVSVDGEPDAVFRTSGTTRGGELRGRHFVPSLSLYRASLMGPFRRHVLGGENAPVRFVSLIPTAEQLPDSSLSFMVSAAADESARETTWLVDGTGSLDVDTLRNVTDSAAAAGEPLLFLGTALAFLHAAEALGGEHLARSVEGSRVMETGGFKGLDRSITRDELRRSITDMTGVSPAMIVNEYGMTELLSQLYEPVVSEGAGASGEHVPPPWLRVRALDPVSLEEAAEGEEGILAFFDLANVGSVCHVLTQDVGSVADGRVRLRGRSVGAEPRGCSRAMDELMSAARVSR